jgi:hypothetical protein
MREAAGSLTALFAALVWCVGTANAESHRFEFDGQVRSIYGSGASLDTTGLSTGSTVRFTVLVDRTGDGYYVSADGSQWIRPDVWTAPEEHRDYFYAELESASYPTPGSYLGYDREFFYGLDHVSETFPDCAVLGRLFVGVELFHIDGCAPVAQWSPGMSVGSAHIWHDDATGQSITVQMDLTVTGATQMGVPLPALNPAGVACLCSMVALVCLPSLRSPRSNP